MNDQIKVYILSFVFLFLALILQSTLLELISIGGAKPDISLIVLVFISLRKGKIVGQFSGFISGFIEDFLSLPLPIGFNALIKTIIGFIYGLFKGRMFISPILMPILIILIATILKIIIAILVTFIFRKSDFSFLSFRLLIEIAYNCIFAPLIFTFLNLFKTLKITDKEKN